MKRFLLPLLAAISLPTAVKANLDPKITEMCMKAVDFQGCVNAMTGNSLNNNLENLRKAIKILPSRLSNTNLRDFSSNTQQFRDALSSIEIDNLNSQDEKSFYLMSLRISNMVNSLQNAWSNRINKGTNYSEGYFSSYECDVLRPDVVRFNLAAGDNRVIYNGVLKRSLFGPYETCSPQEINMINVIAKDVNEILNKPDEAVKKLFDPNRVYLRVDKNPKPYDPNPKKEKGSKEGTSNFDKKNVKINCNSPVWKKRSICS